jgi:type II secretion system protein L
LLSAIEYQVEDQLARDIESQHVAIGNAGANPVSIAVVDRAIMMRCLALAQGHGLRLLQILPELFLCPWTGSGIALMQGYEGYLLRFGDYRGFKCNADALPAMLKLIGNEVEFEQITCYGDGQPPPGIDDYQIETRPLAEARPGFVDAPVIDLQQRDFQLSSPWHALGRAWKWIAILLAALLAVGGYNKAVALQALEQDLAAVRQQQFELVKSYLPADIGPNDNLKKALIERLKQVQSSQNKQGFLKLLLEFSRARAKFPEVEITRIGYQGKELVFDISSTQLNKIETLLEAVQKRGIDATLVNLNIKPERSSGRLVLNGGDDV